MTRIKHILLTAALVLACALNAGAVDVIITEGLSNQQAKTRIETTLSALLTEVNAACEEGREPNLQALNLPEDVSTTIEMLWENSPFMCIDDEVAQKCLQKSGGKLQVRNIPLLLQSQEVGEGEDYQEAVATFDGQGNILSFNLSISMNLYLNIIKNNRGVADARRRELILDWTEQFRTAYNEHNLSFLDAVFSDDALIITGRVVQRKTGDGVRLPDEVVFKTQNKREYLNNLKTVFNKDHKNLIRVTFDEIEIMRHPNPDMDMVYGVTLHQGYTSGTYHDDGYVFLLWDFTDEDHPKIHVRTWQPDAFNADGTGTKRIDHDDIISFNDVEGLDAILEKNSSRKNQ